MPVIKLYYLKFVIEVLNKLVSIGMMKITNSIG
jgi:hypothetical protein